MVEAVGAISYTWISCLKHYWKFVSDVKLTDMEGEELAS